MSDRARHRPRLSTFLLGSASAAAVVAAVIVVGPSDAAGGGDGERLVSVARGVVQTTVSGSGSVEAARQLDLDFETSGTVTKVYVTPGQQVAEGQLLAQLDPTDAQEALDDAEEALADAQSGTATTTGASAPAADALATVAAVDPVTAGGAVAYQAVADETSTTQPETTTTPDTTATTTTPDETTTPGATTTPDGTTTPGETTPGTTTPSTTTTPGTTTPSTPRQTGGGGTRATPEQSTTTPGTGTGTRAGGSPSAGAAGGGTSSAEDLDDLEAAVEEAREALAATKLRAPMAGTVASVGLTVGQAVSATSSGGSASSSSDGGGATGGAGGLGAAGASSGSGSTESDAAIVLVDLDAMDLVVPFSESDVGQVRRGQPAVVTVNALPDEQLAAHVVSVATLPTTSSSVVSYDVTLRLDQLADGLKAGMTASAQVVVEEADGVLNVPSSAVSGRGSTGRVTVADGDRREQRRVTIGIVGDTTTQILDGLEEGDQLAVAAAPTSTAQLGGGASAGAGATGQRGGLAGALGGGAGGGFPGGGAVFRGGGGPPGGP